MVNITNANQPQWRTVTVRSHIPTVLKPLDEMAHNLWFCWNQEALELFKSLDAKIWSEVQQNPVELLNRISYKRLKVMSTDKDLVARMNSVYKQFRDYMDEPKRTDRASVAYLCMEYGMNHNVKIYSGGLGILAGDYVKEASDSNVDMTAVGFLYRYGYFTQTLSMDGQQISNYEPQNFNQLPIDAVIDENGNHMLVEVPYPGRTIYARIWRVNVGRMKLYLLDTDIDLNSEYDRSITHQLYGGDWENRIKQEYMLGIGGVLMLKKLGIKSDLYHCNEGHAALLNLQRLLDYVQEEKLDFNVALELVRASSLYTVHTPVPAGHDYFDEGLFGKYMGEFPAKLGISWGDLMNMGRENPDTNERFSMSVFALNTCQEANGVSWLHGEVSKKMFQGVWKGYSAEESHVSYVTNGVHMPTWAASEWKEFYKNILGPTFMENQSDENTWAPILKAKDEDIWKLRMTLKNKFINFIKKDFTENWLKNQGDPSRIIQIVERINPNALLIGFARRFATYKRAHLLFTDLDRLSKIVNNEKFPVQFIFSGKAHPADGAGQGLIKRIIEVSRMPQFLGKIIFLENYDMIVAKRLVTGVDIWLNTPTRPLEASGTSGEKAEMNGVLNFSVLDGWWYEGYRKDAGWALTEKRTFTDQSQQDKLDAATIYSMLENEIIPLYFAKNSRGYSPEWIQFIKNSIAHIAPNFTMKRMIDDYINRFYNKEAQRSRHLAENNYAKAKEIAEWKQMVASKWDDIKAVEIQLPDMSAFNSVCGTEFHSMVKLDTAGLGSNIGVELVVYSFEDNNMKFKRALPMEITEENGDILTFSQTSTLKDAGEYRFAFRVFPNNSELPHRQDFAYVKWI